MISRVLVATDGSEVGDRALEYALEAHPDAAITLINVVGEQSRMGGKATGLALSNDLSEATEDLARDIFERSREIADEYNADIVTEVGVGHPARAILDRADAFETVVIGAPNGTASDGYSWATSRRQFSDNLPSR